MIEYDVFRFCLIPSFCLKVQFGIGPLCWTVLFGMGWRRTGKFCWVAGWGRMGCRIGIRVSAWVGGWWGKNGRWVEKSVTRRWMRGRRGSQRCQQTKLSHRPRFGDQTQATGYPIADGLGELLVVVVAQILEQPGCCAADAVCNSPRSRPNVAPDSRPRAHHSAFGC